MSKLILKTLATLFSIALIIVSSQVITDILRTRKLSVFAAAEMLPGILYLTVAILILRTVFRKSLPVEFQTNRVPLKTRAKENLVIVLKNKRYFVPILFLITGSFFFIRFNDRNLSEDSTAKDTIQRSSNYIGISSRCTSNLLSVPPESIRSIVTILRAKAAALEISKAKSHPVDLVEKNFESFELNSHSDHSSSFNETIDEILTDEDYREVERLTKLANEESGNQKSDSKDQSNPNMSHNTQHSWVDEIENQSKRHSKIGRIFNSTPIFSKQEITHLNAEFLDKSKVCFREKCLNLSREQFFQILKQCCVAGECKKQKNKDELRI